MSSTRDKSGAPAYCFSYILIKEHNSCNISVFLLLITGADPGFQVRGGANLKKLRRAEGGAKNFGVFRVKNHDFTPKNHIFPILGGRGLEPPLH